MRKKLNEAFALRAMNRMDADDLIRACRAVREARDEIQRMELLAKCGDPEASAELEAMEELSFSGYLRYIRLQQRDAPTSGTL